MAKQYISDEMREGLVLTIAVMALVGTEDDKAAFADAVSSGLGLDANRDRRISEAEVQQFLTTVQDPQRLAEFLEQLPEDTQPAVANFIELARGQIGALRADLVSHIRVWAAEGVLDRVIDEMHEMMQEGNFTHYLNNIAQRVAASEQVAQGDAITPEELAQAVALANVIRAHMVTDIDFPGPGTLRRFIENTPDPMPEVLGLLNSPAATPPVPPAQPLAEGRGSQTP